MPFSVSADVTNNLVVDCLASSKLTEGSQDFLTSNSFYHGLTKTSQGKIVEKASVPNEVINSLDPSVFEVAAKKKSLMWES